MEVSYRKRPAFARRLGSAFVIAIFVSNFSLAADGVAAKPRTKFDEERMAIGKKNGVTYEMGPIENPAEEIPATPAPTTGDTGGTTGGNGDGGLGADDAAGLYATLKAMLFGKDRSILSAQASVSGALEGETDFYWGGFKVWSTKPTWQDGAFVVSAGLPTVSMRAPLVAVPVGPVTLRVDAGVAAEAALEAKLMPLISIPVQFTSVRAELGPEVAAAGFVEGYAKFIAIRAGVGGELELVRANATVAGQVGFGGYAPTFEFDGFINLLAGKIYGFVDYFNIFRWKWKRALEPKFADWKGKCIDLRKDVNFGGDPCAP